MKRVLLVSLLVLVLGFSVMPGVTGARSADPSTYIVVFHEDQDPEATARGLQRQYGVEVGGIYRYALKGAVIHATSRQALEIEQDGRVDFIELNQVYSIDAQTVPTGIDRVFAPENSLLYIDETDDKRVNADVAVLDTGIDFDHPDLNLVMAIDCTWSGPKEGTCAGTRDDGHGHGTHVAGTVGALDNGDGVVGVAPGVRLWAVKVLTNYGTGTSAQVIAGIDFVAAHADQIEVANMSLSGGGESDAMYDAIENAVQLGGVTFVLSAGNSAADVSGYHPAGHPDAITVSALADFDGLPGSLGEATCRDDIDDTLAYFSNYGEDVTMIGPGICIYSTYQDGGYATMSGTSMSAPHVAGAAAILASMGDYTPAQIRDTLTAEGNYDWVDDSGDGYHEPLLDLSTDDDDDFVFAPTFLPEPLPITLTGDAYKVGKNQFADLYWTSDGDGLVDIYRDGTLLITTENDGAYTDGIDRDDAARIHFYWLCEAGTEDTCSASLILYHY